MRHRNKINSLGRKAAHRKETMASMATALILNKRINTTLAKAKALRVYVEPLITRSKVDSTHSRRMVFSYLKNKHAVSELFREIAQKVADRPGGYTRILKTGYRKGDAAEMCFIELVDYNTAMLKTEEETQQKRTRRGRRRGKKAKEEDQVKVASQEATAETPVAPEEEISETDAPAQENVPEDKAPEDAAGEEAPQEEKTPEDKAGEEAPQEEKTPEDDTPEDKTEEEAPDKEGSEPEKPADK